MPDATRRSGEPFLRDALVIVLFGVVAGLAFNLAQLGGRPPRGLPWVGLAARSSIGPSLAPAVILPSRAPAPAAQAPPAPAPRAKPTEVETRAPAAADLPAIPDVDRPLAVRLPMVSRFVQADAALVVDARDPSEFAAGHIPGAVNVPYEEAARDPAPLGRLQPAGRPIIVYCSGGDCEASALLAPMMVRDFKLRRVLV